jgi:hypothetical protein
MANGARAVALLSPFNSAPAPILAAVKPPPAPVTSPDKPAAPIDREIAVAAADAAVVIGQAISNFQRFGVLVNRSQAGETLGICAELLLNTFDEINFVAVRRTAKGLLHERYAAVFQAQQDMDEKTLDRGLDVLIEYALGIAIKVSADERALLQANAN